MEVQFTITSEDVQKFRPAGWWRRRVFGWALLLLLLAIPTGILLLMQRPWAAGIGFVLCCGLAIYLLSRRIGGNSPIGEEPVRLTVILAKKYLAWLRDDGVQSWYTWGLVSGIDDGVKEIIIRLEPIGRYMIIPSSAFEGAARQTNFAQQAAYHWEAEKERIDYADGRFELEVRTPLGELPARRSVSYRELPPPTRSYSTEAVLAVLSAGLLAAAWWFSGVGATAVGVLGFLTLELFLVMVVTRVRNPQISDEVNSIHLTDDGVVWTDNRYRLEWPWDNVSGFELRGQHWVLLGERDPMLAHIPADEFESPEQANAFGEEISRLRTNFQQRQSAPQQSQ